MLRSIAAVVLGYLVLAAPIIALFAAWFRTPAAVPTPAFMRFSLAYAFAFAVVAGYLTGVVARRLEMAHAVALAALCALLGLASMVTTAGREPVWYQAANLGFMVAGVLLGGRLRRRQRRRREA